MWKQFITDNCTCENITFYKFSFQSLLTRNWKIKTCSCMDLLFFCVLWFFYVWVFYFWLLHRFLAKQGWLKSLLHHFLLHRLKCITADCHSPLLQMTFQVSLLVIGSWLLNHSRVLFCWILDLVVLNLSAHLIFCLMFLCRRFPFHHTLPAMFSSLEASSIRTPGTSLLDFLLVAVCFCLVERFVCKGSASLFLGVWKL